MQVAIAPAQPWGDNDCALGDGTNGRGRGWAREEEGGRGIKGDATGEIEGERSGRATCGTDFEPCGVVEDPDVGLPPSLTRQRLVLSTGLQTRAIGQHLERMRDFDRCGLFSGYGKGGAGEDGGGVGALHGSEERP